MFVYDFPEEQIGRFKLDSNLIDKANVEVGVFDLTYLFICPINESFSDMDALKIGTKEGLFPLHLLKNQIEC